MINYGNWQDIEKLQGQNQTVNPHKSGIAALGRALDPMTYIPGIKEVANPIHDGAEYLAEKGNQVLSPVVGAAQKLTEFITPGLKQFNKAVGLDGLDQYIRDKPLDAAAIAAATFFTAGAAGGAASALAAPAASGGAGAAGGLAGFGAAGSAAVTPAFASGAVGAGVGAGAAGSTTGALIGAGAITPAFASGAIGGGAGAFGAGTLGAAGTAAGTSMLTPSLASLGGAGSSFLDGAGSLLRGAKNFNSYRSNLNAMSGTSRQPTDNRSDTLANMIVSSNTPGVMQDKISKQIVMNKFGRR